MQAGKKNGKKKFTSRLMQWHQDDNKRLMPWKGEKNAYKIWLSEIILQQTRVDQGRAYYEKFILHYPDIKDLAAADDDQVFKLWEGLGYYSRCKNLLATARLITNDYGGIFPNTYAGILTLKGIGPYTAAAISSFAFNLPHAVLDGNVYRVLSRYFGIHTPSDSTEGKKIFTALADECLDAEKPSLYNQAIMDFGATVCTPANPDCERCVLQIDCTAFRTDMVSILPVKTKMLQKKHRWFTYFLLEKDGQLLIRKRTEKDIWQNLHEFLMEESTAPVDWDDKAVKQYLKNRLGISVDITGRSEQYIQQLTHQTIYARFITINVRNGNLILDDFFLQSKASLHLLAFPKTITRYLEERNVQSALF